MGLEVGVSGCKWVWELKWLWLVLSESGSYRDFGESGVGFKVP